MLYDLRCYNHNAQCQTELDRDQKQPATDMRMYALPGRESEPRVGGRQFWNVGRRITKNKERKEKKRKSKEQDD